jgi:hypothetical protein
MAVVTIDFIAKDPWRMVLVEEGPWAEADIDTNLQRLQERLYACVDAALDGELSKIFPESTGHSVLIRLDCFNVPDHQVRGLFARFSASVLEMPDYKAALADNRFVTGMSFEINCSQMH